jgi:cyclophilin family peptidyl-prolyl cis-trans isomerase
LWVARADDEAPVQLDADGTAEVMFRTEAGSFVMKFQPEWAPLGVDHFLKLERTGFYCGTRFFRVIKGFMAQFGLSNSPPSNDNVKQIKDDPVKKSNTRGMMSFATSGPNTRGSQLFVNTADNSRLDSMGFAPIGEVISGLEVVDKLNSKYGDNGPDQGKIRSEGGVYMDREFDDLTKLYATHRLIRDVDEGSPDTVLVRCGTTKGPFDITVHPSWAPIGAKRFLDMVSGQRYAVVRVRGQSSASQSARSGAFARRSGAFARCPRSSTWLTRPLPRSHWPNNNRLRGPTGSNCRLTDWLLVD